MKCKKCGNSELFYVSLDRLVQVHTLGGEVLDIHIDDEQLQDTGAYHCECGSTEVDVTNEDIDSFWKLFGKRVSRKITNPKWLTENGK